MNLTFKLNEFDLDQNILGKGFMAKIFKAYHRPTKKTYALKAIDIKKAGEQEKIALSREEKIHRTLDHPNIVKFYNSFTENGMLYFVLELVDGEELFEYAVKRDAFSE
jgi:serine/threonine protein kinase